ncbi:hypothetical protein DUNSADRAFT_12848 [Dunaliella salina]|uniref:Encoded protein n=1 Tax=Dunaliella salina TaxID=3046 RepID=A0ABQ7H9R0_DUNSA|nr:hypothetical protein DUNSADRAFT_12848 [Dunaliella salina]|eukprot:KAF5843586.1 hypothetical protein DUNSADRAFT_12848 [Dunaliella salina]
MPSSLLNVGRACNFCSAGRCKTKHMFGVLKSIGKPWSSLPFNLSNSPWLNIDFKVVNATGVAPMRPASLSVEPHPPSPPASSPPSPCQPTEPPKCLPPTSILGPSPAPTSPLNPTPAPPAPAQPHLPAQAPASVQAPTPAQPHLQHRRH